MINPEPNSAPTPGAASSPRSIKVRATLGHTVILGTLSAATTSWPFA